MRTRHVTRALLLVAVAAAPLPSAAASVNAQAGVLYSRSDQWAADGATGSLPNLDLDLGLDARGVIVSQDVFDYSLKARWGRLSTGTSGATTVRNMLSYGGRASLFDNVVSPIRLSGFASRGETDFSTSSAPDSFGRGIATGAGGSIALKGTGLSSLSADYSWTSSESSIAGEPMTRDTTQHAFSSQLSFDNDVFRVDATYFGELREGSWGTDQYAVHSGTMRASTLVGTHTLSFAASSSLTIPEELVEGTFEQRSTTFSTLLNSGGAGNRRSFAYGYGHTTSESLDTPTTEIGHQGLRYEGDHFVRTDRFFTRWLVDASVGEARSDEDVLRTTGETLGVGLWYRHLDPSSTLELNAGPRVSLIQTEDGDSGGYGASAGIRYARPVGLHAAQMTWNGSYGSNLFANAGWQFTQDLGASLSGPFGTARYNVNFRANAFRTHSPVTGDGAGRSIDLVGTLAGSRGSLEARASVSEGMLGATPQQFTSDGLLLPAPFDSTIIDAAVGGTVKLYPGLAASLRGRFGRADVPGRPVPLHELGASAALTYQYAALSIALEDRISRAETVGGWDTSNLFLVTVSRSFGW